MKSPLIARQRSRRSPRRDDGGGGGRRSSHVRSSISRFSEKQARAYGIFSRYPRRSGAPRHRQSSRSFPTVALVSLFPLPSPSLCLCLSCFSSPRRIYHYPRHKLTPAGSTSCRCRCILPPLHFSRPRTYHPHDHVPLCPRRHPFC